MTPVLLVLPFLDPTPPHDPRAILQLPAELPHVPCPNPQTIIADRAVVLVNLRPGAPTVVQLDPITLVPSAPPALGRPAFTDEDLQHALRPYLAGGWTALPLSS